MPKRSPEEVWRQLVDEAGEDEIERATSVSVAQAEKELAEAGFDVAAERAKAEAIIDELEATRRVSERVAIGRTKQAPVSSAKTNKGRQLEAPKQLGSQPPAAVIPVRARWVFAFAALLAAAAVAILTGPALVGHGQDVVADRERATALRAQASRECPARQWEPCLEHLDKAKALDPGGEDDQMRAWRLAAQAALHGGGTGR